MNLLRYMGLLACVGLGCGSAWGQSVIAARSGVIHYIEGDVTIDGTLVHPKFAEFPALKEGEVLATQEGRAEVLLTPGVFLRLAENSSVRLLANALADTRMEVVSGSALIEAGELLANNAVSFEHHGVRIALRKKGLYRIDADAGRLQVYDGQALITSGFQTAAAKKGHEIALDSATLTDAKFDVKNTDPFYRWSGRRADYIAAANVTSARVESNSSYRAGYLGTGGRSSWTWNPYFGMFTYVPAQGIYMSPFGAAFYSRGMMNNVFIPQRMYVPQRANNTASPMRGGSPRGGFGAGGGTRTFGGPGGVPGGRGGGGFSRPMGGASAGPRGGGGRR